MNIAFIDGQNLHLGTYGTDKMVREGKITEEERWKIDFEKFRQYLKDKYKIDKAYYFIGYIVDDYDNLYKHLQECGFIVEFKNHSQLHKSKKKGNVDINIVFESMKMLYEKEEVEKIFLVSGDGDYKILVDHLVSKDKFGKILFPNNKRYSSLYKELGSECFDFLTNPAIKNRIQKEKGS